jgi:hypothetical protein
MVATTKGLERNPHRWRGNCKRSTEENPMSANRIVWGAAKWAATGVGFAASLYATYVGVTWLRYGKPHQPFGKDHDELLDRFIPTYDVADRRKTWVAAPPEVTIGAAGEIDFENSPVVRAIFKGRELIMRSKPVTPIPAEGLLSQVKSLGWCVLAERPGREIILGAATKPWEANPVFRALSSEEFAQFAEPGFVKIAWTLRADPAGDYGSIFRTETRAVATDADSRRKFRPYWSFLSPGIILIRQAMLKSVRREAEAQWRDIAA